MALAGWGGFDIGNHYRFDGDDYVRILEFDQIDATQIECLGFSIIRGNDNNGGEDPDSSDEILTLEYSIDGGSSFQVASTVVDIGDSSFDSLKTVFVQVPAAAQTASTIFRLYQDDSSGDDTDHYGILNQFSTSGLNINIDSFSKSGNVDELEFTDAQLQNMLTLAPASPLYAGPSDVNNLTWTFDAGSDAFDYLGAGSFLKLHYSLTATDQQGASSRVLKVNQGGLDGVTYRTGGDGTGEMGGFDIGNHYRFDGDDYVRILEFDPIDASAIQALTFSIIRGNDDNGGEDPDSDDESLLLQYSTDNGDSFQLASVVVDDDDSSFDSLKIISVSVPTAAQTASTIFRLYQEDSSNYACDHYGILDTFSSGDIEITITGTNDAPEATDQSVTALEDEAYVIGVDDFGLTDPIDNPDDPLHAVRIVSLPAKGNLKLDGNPVALNDEVLAADIRADKLTWSPAAGESGTNYASFQFQVQDGVAAWQYYRLIIDETRDSDIVQLSEFAFVDTDGNRIPGGTYSNENGESPSDEGPENLGDDNLDSKWLNFYGSGSIVNLDFGLPVAATGYVMATANDSEDRDPVEWHIEVSDDNQTWQTVADETFDPPTDRYTYYQNTPFELDLSTQPGLYAAAANEMTFDVVSVNDAPSGTNNAVEIDEDTDYVISSADFGFSDPDDTPPDDFGGVVITALPANGSLLLDGNDVAEDEFISAADIDANDLIFRPDENESGEDYASFDFKVVDDGGTDNGGVDSDQTANNFSFDVVSINDAPQGALSLTTPASPLKSGDVLTADPSQITDADGIPATGSDALIVQWQSSEDGTTWSDIIGATGTSLFLDYSLAGLLVRAEARYTDEDGDGIDSVTRLLVGQETVASAASEGVRLFWNGTRENDTKYGTIYSDTINGSDGHDKLYGHDGNPEPDPSSPPPPSYEYNDYLNGGKGTDTLEGGLGNDTYLVDNNNDLIIELPGEGYDHVLASSSYSLKARAANVEMLTLSGSGGNNATGNDLDNVLNGNTANNDLDGGLGNDTMVGDFGNDVYIIDNPADVVIEYIGKGTDEIRSPITTSLPQHVENLTLTGLAAIDGTGNTLNNTIKGNKFANTLLGLLGNDTLEADEGNDTLNGGTGTDRLTGGRGADHFRFNAPLVQFNGQPSTDTISDFKVADNDRIVLSSTVFSALVGRTDVNGVLNADAFYASSLTPPTNAHRIFYNTSNGVLSYDSDGVSGAASPYPFALLNGKPTLSNSFILVQPLS